MLHHFFSSAGVQEFISFFSLESVESGGGVAVPLASGCLTLRTYVRQRGALVPLFLLALRVSEHHYLITRDLCPPPTQACIQHSAYCCARAMLHPLSCSVVVVVSRLPSQGVEFAEVRLNLC